MRRRERIYRCLSLVMMICFIINQASPITVYGTETVTIDVQEEENPPEFYQLNDPALLRHLEDEIYAGLSEELQGEGYTIENVQAIYYSKEYLEELDYNSRENIWFGYTLPELLDQFEGKKFIYTLGDDQKTIVTEFKDYDDTYEKVIKNVAIGTGVILICVTVSVVTAGAGAVPVSMVFAASAKTATAMALSSGGISAVAAGAVTAMQTGDMEQSIKAGALAGSESFKWGAIVGALAGGAGELLNPTTTSPSDFPSNVVDDILDSPVDDVLDTPLDDVINSPVDDVINTPIDDVIDSPVDDIINSQADDVLNSPVDDLIYTSADYADDSAQLVDNINDTTKAIDLVDDLADTGEEFATIDLEELPEKAQETFRIYEEQAWNGEKALDNLAEGTHAGQAWGNVKGDLPITDAAGNQLTYQEFDAFSLGDDPLPGLVPGGRGPCRFVRDNLGNVYFTDDHYKAGSFKLIARVITR